jgi:exoribonuclease II
LGIPVSGSRGVGRARLLAEQGRISLIEVEVGGRIIDVRVDERRIYNSRIEDKIIDANVVDKQVY